MAESGQCGLCCLSRVPGVYQILQSVLASRQVYKGGRQTFVANDVNRVAMPGQTHGMVLHTRTTANVSKNNDLNSFGVIFGSRIPSRPEEEQRDCSEDEDAKKNQHPSHGKRDDRKDRTDGRRQRPDEVP